MANRIFLLQQFNWVMAVYWNSALGFYSCIRLQGRKIYNLLAVSSLVTDLESVNTPWGFGSPALRFPWPTVIPSCHIVSWWIKCHLCWVLKAIQKSEGEGIQHARQRRVRIVWAFKENQRAFGVLAKICSFSFNPSLFNSQWYGKYQRVNHT